MANLKVTLVWRCKTLQGWHRFPALFASNGRPRAGVIAVDGQEITAPIGRFQLRFYDGGRMLYEDAGENPTEAMQARKRVELRLAAKAAADAAGVKIEDDGIAERRSLHHEFQRFIEEVESRGKKEAAKVYYLAGYEFLRCSGKTFVDELNRDDLVRYQRKLRDNGLSDRTIFNRDANVRVFLVWLGLEPRTLAPKPQYEEAIPVSYKPSDLTSFFSAPALLKKPKLAMTFEILLKCGLREQEAMYLEWTNVDLERGKLLVRSNPRFEFRVKDKEQREIPIEANLLALLKTWRSSHPKDRLVAGTASDRPHSHLLRTLKRLAKGAGLNCGACDGCSRRVNPECERWFLHKFRATYITRLLQGGMDLRTVMKYSGHSDLESVQRYLSPADDEMARGIVNSVHWV